LRRRSGADARRRVVAALAGIALLALVPRARAAEEFLSQLQTVAEIRFRGLHHLSAKELKRALRTPSPSPWPWADEVPLRLDFLNADTLAIRAAYRERGFLDARVESVLVTPAHAGERAGIVITFAVTEGERSIIRSVDMTGNPNYPLEQLRKKLFARPGRPFNPGFMSADTARISLAYQDRGYKPIVEPEVHRDSLDPLAVHVAYHVAEGPLYHFGAVYLSSPGGLKVKEKLIRRELLIKPGETYRTSKVDESQQHLYETGLFSQVHMTPLPDSSNATVEFDLRVRERKPRWIAAGLGSSTSERFRMSGEWGHRDLLGRSIQGALGGQLAFDDKGRFLRARGEASVLEPWAFGVRVRGFITPYYEKGVDRTDTSWVRHYDARGLRFELRRDLALRTHLLLIQDNTFVTQGFDLISPDSATLARFGEVPVNYAKHSLQLGYEGDLRDNPVNPAVGSYVLGSGQLAGGPLGGGTFLYSKTQMVASKYRQVGTRGWVMGWRAGGGLIRPFGEVVGFSPEATDAELNRVPSPDRFRIGGVNSVRGYSESQITSQGGLTFLLLNAEMRIPVIGPFGLEAYVDGGNVWARPSEMKASHLVPEITPSQLDPGDMRYVLGLGGRLNLPFGPLRVDFTWNLQPDRGLNGSRWLVAEPQFGIGPSF
jgi:outer membrane protein insertion porin family